MGDDGIQELTRAAADLLAELAAVHAEGEALRRELESTWGCLPQFELEDEQDSIITLRPISEAPSSWDDAPIDLDPESRRDTLRC